MRFRKTYRNVISVVLSIGMTAWTAPGTNPTLLATELGRPIVAADVELAPGGLLRGRICDPAGVPAAPHALEIRTPHRPSIRVQTNTQGEFSVPDLHGGVVEITDGTRAWSIRCWTPGTAPPAAVQVVQLTGTDPVVRGQVAPSCWGLSNPWVIAGIVAAAIAIPIALYANRDDRDNASD